MNDLGYKTRSARVQAQLLYRDGRAVDAAGYLLAQLAKDASTAHLNTPQNFYTLYFAIWRVPWSEGGRQLFEQAMINLVNPLPPQVH